MTNLALTAHRTLCRLNLHLWGRSRRQTGVAGLYRTCLSCRAHLRLPVQTKADASHAAKVAAGAFNRPLMQPTKKAEWDELADAERSVPAHLPLTPEGLAAEGLKVPPEMAAHPAPWPTQGPLT